MASSTDADLHSRLRRQEVVADLGQRAVETTDLDSLLSAATVAVAETLSTSSCEVFEWLPANAALRRRAGTDAQAATTKSEVVAADGDSPLARAFQGATPVVVDAAQGDGGQVTDDGRADEDGQLDEDDGQRTGEGKVTPEDSGIAAGWGANADAACGIAVVVGDDEPWGVFAVQSTTPRTWTDEEVAFVEHVADVLGAAVERNRERRDLEERYARISDGFFALDDDRRFTHLNDRAHDLINPEGRSLVGENVWDAFPAAVERTFEEKYERAMAEQETVSFEEYYPEPLDRWFEVRAYPSETGLSVYFRDVTERKEAEERLAEERDIFAEGPAMVFRWRAAEGWPVTYVSDNVEEVLGYSPAELESGDVPYTDLLLDEELERIEREVETNSDDDTERFSHDPYRVRTGDGDVKWVKDTTKIIRDDDGEITHYLGYLVDITERKERERELRQYETIVEAVNDGVYVLDDENHFTMVNDAYAEMLGYEPVELIGEPVSLVVDDENEEAVAERVQELEAALRRGESDVGVLEADLETVEGERISAEASFALLSDADTDAHRVGVVRDVTERRARERELERYETLFVESSDVNAILDSAGTFTYLPPSVENVLGYEADDLVGENAFDYVHPEDRDAVIEEFARMAEDADYRPKNEFRFRHADGSWIWLESVGRNLLEEPHIEGLVAYTRDVTERKEHEQALAEQERQLSTLMENVPGMVYRCRNERGWPMEYVSDACETLTGYDSSALERGDVNWGADVMVDADREQVWEDIQSKTMAGGTFSETYRIETADGERRWVRDYGRSVGGEDGESAYIEGIIEDVTEQVARQQELQRTERRFEAVFEDPNILVGLLDTDGTVLDINQTAMEYVDADLDAITGEPFWETPWWGTGEDIRADVMEWTERAAAGEYVDFEADLTRPDGSRYVINGMFRPVTNDDGDVVSILVSDRDVTERREYERQLQESERRYRTLVEHFPNGAVALVDEDLHYQTVGGNPLEVAGTTVEDTEGKPVEDALPPALAVELAPRYEAALDGESSAFEFELADHIYQFHVVPIRDDDGEVFAALGMSQDVTERTKAQRQLRESERRYRTLAENFPTGGVGVFDDDLRYTLVTGTMWDDIEVDAADLEGKTIWDALPVETAADVEPIFRAALDGETDSVVSTLGGRTYQIWATPLQDADGEITGGQSFALDITEQLEREQQLEESERRYRTLAEYFPNGIVTLFDRDLVYTLVAGQGFEDIPVDPADAEGSHFSEVWDADTVDTLEPVFQGAIDGEERTVELTYEGREWILHGVPITDERGDVFAGMTMAQDITEQKERERDLADAKSRLEAATEAGAIGTWEWNVQTDRMVTGPSFARTFGIDPDATIEGVSLDRFVDRIHEDDRERVEREIEAALSACGEYEAEYRVWNEDDELLWVVARGHVECDEDGDPVTFPGALTDITDRKRAELALERNRDQLESLFELLPVGVVVADADGAIVDANDTAREIWGVKELTAESVADYEKYPVRWADSGEPVEPHEMTLARVVDGEPVTDPDIFEIEAQDGEERIIRAEGMPIRNDHGRVTRGVVTLTDITERREAQRRLAQSERRYRTLVENFPNGSVGLFDQDLRYTAIGGQLLESLGMNPEDRIGERIPELHPDELFEQIEPYFQAALDGESNVFEVEFAGRDLYAHALPVSDGDDPVAGMLVVQDVTERKEYEQRLEESNERLEQFAYAASHDLQEPLRMVSSYLQLIEQRYGDELDDDGQEFIEFAVDGANRMRDMIDGLLKYSRVDAKGDPFEPVDLDAVLADVRDDLQMTIQEHDAEITVESLPTIEGDPSQLRQLFQNLLDNAVEYSGDAPPRVHVSAERDGDRWSVSVRDEGIGIDPADADRVFEVFQRLHGPETHTGTGIGLALCERIVERHGGDIWVDSVPGEGSTFTFTLPVDGEYDD